MWTQSALAIFIKTQAALVVRALLTLVAALAFAACSSDDADPAASGPKELDWPCEISPGAEAPDSLRRMGCVGDFRAFASQPLDASIPGARSAKVLIDLYDNDTLYFQNRVKYPIHFEIATAHLSGMGIRLITDLAAFNPQ